MEIKNIIIGILVVAIAMASLAYAYKEPVEIDVPDDNKEDATIRVSGESQIEVEPDIAYIYIEIETEGSTAEEAKKRNNKLSEDVMEALEFTYIKDIETDSFNVRKTNSWEVTNLRQYVATNVLKITTDDIDWVDQIVDKAINNGATGIRRIYYELSEDREEEIKKKALKRASENAYEKAVAIAEGLDKEIGNLISVEESEFRYMPYKYATFDFVAEGNAETNILPEDLEVTASITLVYNIN